MTEVLVQSLNVGTATISHSLGQERFYACVSKFGFGKLTEIDLQSESPGYVRRPGDPMWSPSDLATNSYGQGIATTAIQMVAATGAIANRGMLMRPHVVSSIIVRDRALQVQPVSVQQVVSPETAATVTQMMVETVERGTHQAMVPGYTIAGKTGTAQVYGDRGYDPDASIASFVGFAPADAPRFAVLVKIEKTAGEEAWGMYVAAPIFRRIAERVFVYLDIPPDEVRLRDQTQEAKVVPYEPSSVAEGEG